MASSNSSSPLPLSSPSISAISSSAAVDTTGSASAPTTTPTESLSTSTSFTAAASSMSSSSTDPSSSPPISSPSNPPSSTSTSNPPSSISTSNTPPPPPPSSSTTSSTTSLTTSSTTSISNTPTSSTIPPTSVPPTSSDTDTRSSPSDPPSSANSNPPSRDPPETLRSTVFVTTTDSLGRTTTSTPSIITQVLTITSNGVAVTTTETKVNPTLNSDGHSPGGSAFFKNTGTVAGVFALVGLAAAAIFLWVLFGLRRRRRNRRREHDTAVSATLAAAGFQRAPLDDDEQHGNDSMHSRALPEMRESSAGVLGTVSSLPSGGRTSGYQDSPAHDETDAFNPYNEYDAAGPGYIPARTSSPPPTAFVEPYRDTNGSGPDHTVHHSASQSVGSTEPLLASYNRAEPVSPAPSGALLGPPTPPPRNPKRVIDGHSQPSNPPPVNRRQSSASSVYSSESTGDERLNPAVRNSDIQDSEDYSRVLGVRNFPDGVSQVSGES